MSVLGRGPGAVRWLGSFALLSLGVSSCAESRSGEGGGEVRTQTLAFGARVWTEKAALAASDAVGLDGFGSAIATDGNTAVITAATSSQRPGAAYVFVGSGSSWTEQAKLTAADVVPLDSFGRAVGISGNSVIVGTPEDDLSSQTGPNEGSAYVFVRTGTTWSQQQKLSAPDAANNEFFGWSVAIDGNTAVVGAYQAEMDVDALGFEGAAYVFVRTGTTWAFQQKLAASQAPTHNFGSSVAISGNTIIVGSPNDAGPWSDPGFAYVYTRSGSTWSEQARLSPQNSQPEAHVGYVVALQGDTAAVGSWGDSRVSMFSRSGTSWTERGTHLIDKQVSALALDGDLVVVGGTPSISQNRAGAVYVSARSGTEWQLQTPLYPSTASATNGWGAGVGIRGGTIFARAMVGTSMERVLVFTEDTGGSGGSGGTSGASGAGAGGAGAGGAGGASAGTGGASAGTGGSSAGTGGSSAGTGGTSSGGSGRAGSGGDSGEAGASGEGGAGGESGTAGETGGGTSGTGGVGGAGAGTGSGGSVTAGTSGAPGAGASSVAGNGGSSTAGGATGNGSGESDDSSGCGCSIPGRAPRAFGFAWLLAVAAVLSRRRIK